MTLGQIKEAVLSGKNVYWANLNYKVIVDSIGQWLIWSQCNDYYIGLTWQDGVTVNGKPEEFFVAQ